MTIRLNKVTRDLNVGIATVVDFLQKKGYTIEANPNTKITDEQYAALVKEFSKDKDLKIESEKIFQERQNKERNKASVSIDDLDNLNKKKVKPAVVEPAKEEKKEVVEAAEPVEKPALVQVEEVTVAEVVQPQPQINEQQKQPEQEKAEDLIPDLMEEKKETPEAQTVQQDKEDEVFKIRPTEFKSKINVVGQIDLAALNQSTRPKKKTKEEKRKEREEKDKQRLEQRKQMKDAIIKEIRKTDEKTDKGGQNDVAGKKKRNRINKERVDINAAGSMTAPRGGDNKAGKGNANAAQGGGKHNKDRFKKPVVKPEVSDEDVAKQVKETLARLTNKGKNKAAKYRKEKRESIQNRQLEQEELEQETDMLSHAEEIKAGLFRVGQLLTSDEGGLLAGLKESLNTMLGLQKVYSPATELAERLESTYIELKDVSQEVSSQEEDVEFNPDRLEEVNDRLNLIYTLQQKHRATTVEELLTLAEEYAAKLAAITSYDERIGELTTLCDTLYNKVRKQAAVLTKARTGAAREVEKQMASRLVPLGMPNVRFQVEMGIRKEPGVHGEDTVNFLFSANKNGSLQNISSVASGGEIARVMLSIKAMIAGAVKLPTIVFDEIDTGVSGEIADRMADIMQEMGEQDRQVISITHLPQIAARGCAHYKVYKQDNETETNSHIRRLADEERVEEIAHMLSGATLTEAALNNAKVLLGIKR